MFYVVEEWPILDAFYLNVTTLNTVGLGTLPQPTGTGRIFTVVYIFVGCVGLAFTSMKLGDGAETLKLQWRFSSFSNSRGFPRLSVGNLSWV